MTIDARALVLISALPIVAHACGGSANAVRREDHPPSIRILDPGTEPRQRLRYAPTPHVVERAEQILKLRSNVAFTNTVLETGHRSTDFPSVKLLGRLEVTDVTAEGDAIVTYALEEVTVLDDVIDAGVRQYVEREAARMKGSRASWRMSPTGVLSRVQFAPNDGSSSVSNEISHLRDAFRDSMVVFPDAAVGVGAAWEIHSQYVTSNVVWDRRVTFRLKSLTKNTATVDAIVSMRAAAQALSIEPNATTKLTSGTSGSKAELVVPLSGLAATGTSQGSTELNLSIVRRDLRITSTIQSELLSAFKPVVAQEP